MLTTEAKLAVIKEYATHEGDTGSPEVQVAILTSRITYLTEHLKEHKKDHHSIFNCGNTKKDRAATLSFLLY